MEGWPSAKHPHIPAEEAGWCTRGGCILRGFFKASAARQCLVEVPCSGAARCLPRTLGCGRPLSRVASKGLACCVGPNPMGKRGVLGSPRGWNCGDPGSDPARGGRRRNTTHGTDREPCRLHPIMQEIGGSVPCDVARWLCEMGWAVPVRGYCHALKESSTVELPAT
jgi:hypothetical protein